MSTSSSGFIGDIPSHYDGGLGPNIFHDYGDRLADLCNGATAQNVLELAASMPPRFKIRGRTQKWLLREAFKDMLPAETTKRLLTLLVPILTLVSAAIIATVVGSVFTALFSIYDIAI